MNSNLISRDDLKEKIINERNDCPMPDSQNEYYQGIYHGLTLALILIDNATTIDVDEKAAFSSGYLLGKLVEERPQGEWKVYGRQDGIPISDYCTNCKYEMKWYRNKYNYCPNCGAKMKGSAEE